MLLDSLEQIRKRWVVLLHPCLGNVVEEAIFECLDGSKRNAEISDGQIIATDEGAIGPLQNLIKLAEEGFSLSSHVLWSALLLCLLFLIFREVGCHVLGHVQSLVDAQAQLGVVGVQLGRSALHRLSKLANVAQDGEGLGVLDVTNLQDRHASGVQPFLLHTTVVRFLQASILEIHSDGLEGDADWLGAASVEVEVDKLVWFGWKTHRELLLL
mmetsp:Transcript_9496/g.25801  ORF Transcript_9496/g.25801 Transcript_9496/m.25801 type:complete len:213 (+) Transcript_9496:157-795(+)